MLDSIELNAFLRDIALVHYSDELLSVFQEPLNRELKGDSLLVINKTAYSHTLCCTLPTIAKAKSSPNMLQLVLTSTAQKSHALIEELVAITRKLGIAVQELQEPVPGSALSPLETIPSILVGSIKAFLAQKHMQPEFFKHIELITLDNADIMLNLGYAEDIKTIIKSETIVQVLMFTASENSKIDAIIENSAKTIHKIVLEDIAITPETLTQELYHVNKQEKIPLLLGFADKLTKAIVVCNTKGTAEFVSKKLSANGIPSGLLLSYMNRKEQKETIDGFTTGALKILVTNDKMLERSRLKTPFIINYDLPLSPQAYKLRLHHTDTSAVHKAISFACEEYVYNLPIIEQELGFKIPVLEFSSSLLKEDKAGHMNEYRKYRDTHTENGERHGRQHNTFNKNRDIGKGKNRFEGSRTEKDGHKKTANENRLSTAKKGQNQTLRATVSKQESTDGKNLYAMSTEERLKLYQQKYAAKYEQSTNQNQERGTHSSRKAAGADNHSKKKQTPRNSGSKQQSQQHAKQNDKQNPIEQKANNTDISITDKRKPSFIQSILSIFKPKKNSPNKG